MKSMRHPLRYLIDNFERVVIVFFFSWMVIITSFTVLSRYFFAFTFSWAEQATRIFFVVITFAGISLAARKNAHLKVTALAVAFPKSIANLLYVFGDMVSIIFSFVMAYQIFQLVLLQMDKQQTFAAIPGLPVWVMYLPGTVFLMIFPFRIIRHSLLPRLGELHGNKGGKTK